MECSPHIQNQGKAQRWTIKFITTCLILRFGGELVLNLWLFSFQFCHIYCHLYFPTNLNGDLIMNKWLFMEFGHFLPYKFMGIDHN
jgi:hypothetical protein